MIRYELICEAGDTFEAWFRDSADYDSQEAKGQLICPHCATSVVSKAVMAPAVLRGRGHEREARAAMADLAAKARDHIAKNYDYVGESFAEEARAIHEGEAQERLIWGEAKPEEAKALVDDGVPVAPLPAPFAPTPPRKVN
jgi:hypothetical protein